MTTTNASEDVEQREHSYTAGGNTKYYRQYGRQFDSLLQDQVCSFHMTQQNLLCSLIFLPSTVEHISTQKPAHGIS